MVASMNPGKAVPARTRGHGGHVITALFVSFITVGCTATDLAPVTSTPPSATTVQTPATTTSAPDLTTTTTTTPQQLTTTTTSVGGCRPDPFASPFPEELAALYPGKQITAHVYDTRTGCEYRLNPSNRQPTASVFKVMVMSGTLLEAQMANREVTEWELSQLTPMITQSTNPQVRALWRSFGSSPWFREQAGIFDLTETRITADGGSAWGRTTTSASDQVDLLRQVLLGEWGPIEPHYREQALTLMTSVVPNQTWGVTAGVPSSWTVAQKNGFAGATTNSVGWVDEPGLSDGYVVAILTTGWPSFPTGIPAVEYVNLAIADKMFDTVAGIE